MSFINVLCADQVLYNIQKNEDPFKEEERESLFLPLPSPEFQMSDEAFMISKPILEEGKSDQKFEIPHFEHLGEAKLVKEASISLHPVQQDKAVTKSNCATKLSDTNTQPVNIKSNMNQRNQGSIIAPIRVSKPVHISSIDNKAIHNSQTGKKTFKCRRTGQPPDVPQKAIEKVKKQVPPPVKNINLKRKYSTRENDSDEEWEGEEIHSDDESADEKEFESICVEEADRSVRLTRQLQHHQQQKRHQRHPSPKTPLNKEQTVDGENYEEVSLLVCLIFLLLKTRWLNK